MSFASRKTPRSSAFRPAKASPAPACPPRGPGSTTVVGVTVTVARLSCHAGLFQFASKTPTAMWKESVEELATSGVQSTAQVVIAPPPGIVIAQFWRTRSGWPPPRRAIWMNPVRVAPSFLTFAVTWVV